jgi:metal-responsive CopG/Arc/MetJ family transcriptional regulator
MDIAKLHKLLNHRNQTIPIKLNRDLVSVLNMTIKNDKEFKSRNEFFERSILQYLEEKGCLQKLLNEL